MLPNEIVQKYQEFQEFLKNIPLDEMAKEMNRAELQELEDSIRSCSFRSVVYEISQIRKAKKEEEYPQLLHVHHYPAILEFEFLNHEEQKELDEFLESLDMHDYITSVYKAIEEDEKQQQTLDALVVHGILEKKQFIRCPKCYSGTISKGLNEEEISLVKTVLDSQDEERLEEIEEHMTYNCGHCDEEVYDAMEEFHNTTAEIKVYYQLMKERDTSLDYV